MVKFKLKETLPSLSPVLTHPSVPAKPILFCLGHVKATRCIFPWTDGLQFPEFAQVWAISLPHVEPTAKDTYWQCTIKKWVNRISFTNLIRSTQLVWKQKGMVMRWIWRLGWGRNLLHHGLFPIKKRFSRSIHLFSLAIYFTSAWH